MMRKLLTKTIFSLIITVCIFIAAPRAFGADFQGLGILPGHPDPTIPFSESWFIYNLVPGETKKDSAIVVNNTQETVNLKLYPVDGTTTTDGAFALADEKNRQNGIGAWIKLNSKEITVAPGQKKEVKFAISIPEAAPPGDHLGGIVIENKKIKKGETINVRTRIGVRVYQTVPGELIKKLVLKDVKWNINKEDKIVFAFALENKGNVRVEPNGTFTITNALFGTKEKFDFDLRMVLPEKNTVVPVIWHKTPLIAKISARANIAYGTQPSEKIIYDLNFWYVNRWLKYAGIAATILFFLLVLKRITKSGKKRKK